MAMKLTKLVINEISSVDRGACEDCRIALMKRDNGDDDTPQGPLLFDDIMKSTSWQRSWRARRERKQRQRHLNSPISKTEQETIMPQVDIMKAIGVMEEVLNAQVTPRDGESFAKAFSRKYETDEGYRKQWRDLTDAKHAVLLADSVAMAKGRMASLEPTSTNVGNSNVKDDSAEAVRQLQELVARNGSSLEEEFKANPKLAARTYTNAHRPSSVNMDYLEG